MGKLRHELQPKVGWISSSLKTCQYVPTILYSTAKYFCDSKWVDNLVSMIHNYRLGMKSLLYKSECAISEVPISCGMFIFPFWNISLLTMQPSSSLSTSFVHLPSILYVWIHVSEPYWRPICFSLKVCSFPSNDKSSLCCMAQARAMIQ